MLQCQMKLFIGFAFLKKKKKKRVLDGYPNKLSMNCESSNSDAYFNILLLAKINVWSGDRLDLTTTGQDELIRV